MSDQQALIAALMQVLGTAGQVKTKAAPTVRKNRKGKVAKGKGRAKLTDAERAAYMAKNDAEAIAKFEMAGFKGVKPRVDVLTYNKWIANGRLVRKGEKSIKVGPFRLFHISATDPISPVAGQVTAETITANTVAA